jgi:predicted protein tyrosine phosphatase
MIYVCGLDEMPLHVRALRPGYLVSLVQPEFQPPTPAEIRADRHLRVAVDDVSEPMHGYVAPGEWDVQKLIDFLRGWPGDEALLLHCYAGVSRSTAAALIALVLNADGREMEAAQLLREAAPHAQPNPRIVALGDRLLGREGRLVAAREAMGPAVPAFEGPLVEISPLC